MIDPQAPIHEEEEEGENVPDMPPPAPVDSSNAKFPAVGNRPMGGHSAFLQKRLMKGQKYFDSGDYQMAKQNQQKGRKTTPAAAETGEVHPTPDMVAARKTSILRPVQDQTLHLSSSNLQSQATQSN